ncbi:MAG: hypothetical protein DRJ09_10710 [Bacteroidetes bacterium]|nr:MAG: hypothetical protein DRJ09_10710 [Bacteroidota bacterium]
MLLLIFTSSRSQAQNYFRQEIQQQQAYYDSVGVVGDTTEGSSYAKFQKTLFSWAPRLLPDKDYEDYRQQMLAYADNYTPAQSSVAGNNKKWHLVGPDGKSAMYGTNYTGQIHYVYFPDTSNIKYMFACSPTGGLFNPSDGGTTWQNAGTDKGLPKCGTSSICIDNNGYWYVTTGNGEGFRHHPQWQAAIGLYRSMDEGATWDRIGLKSADGMRKVIEVKDNNPDSTWLLVTTTIGFYQSHNANALQLYWEKLITGDFYDVVIKPDDMNTAFASGSNSTGIYKINLNTGNAIKILDIDTIYYPDSIPDKDKNIWTRRISMNIVSSAPDYLYAIISCRDMATTMYRYKISENKWVKRGRVGFNGDTGHSLTSYGRGLSWTIKDSLFTDSVLHIYGKDIGRFDFLADTLTDLVNHVNAVDKIIMVKEIGHGTHDDCHFLHINSVTGKIWQGNDGGLYEGLFVNDTTISWAIKNNGLAVSNIEYLDVNSNGDFVTSGQFDNGSHYYKTTDGVSWVSLHEFGGDGYQTVIKFPNDYFVSTQEGIINRIINDTAHNIAGQYYPAVDYYCDTTGNNVPYANWSTYYQVTNNYLYMSGRKEVRRYNLSSGSWNSISQFSDPTIYPEMGCNYFGTWEIEVFNDSNMYVSTYGNPDVGKTYFMVYKYLPLATGNRKWEWLGNPPGNKNWIGGIHLNRYNPNNSVFASYGKRIYLITWTGTDTASVHASTWNNITYDLDTTRAQNINAIEQDYHGLYLATDGGVFYKPKGEPQWYNFTGTLPNVAVKDIKIANNRLYAATYGRGVWYGSAPGCDGTGDIVFLKANTTYGTPQSIYNTIFVSNGVTMTVKTELQMGVNAKIVVARGATLVIDGGTITHVCPDLWPGVELRGNAGIAYQDTVNQGRVIIKNGGTIEYAVSGIKTIATFSDDDSTYYDDLTYAGGIILADNATFKNNHTDVWFFPYPKNENGLYNDNLSHFINTNFITDSSYYYFDESPGSRVILDGVRGIMFADALFENTTSLNFTGYNNKGIGIEAWDAG